MARFILLTFIKNQYIFNKMILGAGSLFVICITYFSLEICSVFLVLLVKC